MESKPGAEATSDMKEHMEQDVSNVSPSSVGAINENDLFNVAKNERPQVEAFIERLEGELQESSLTAPRVAIPPKWFTATMVVFASLGGLLFGLDQSLISGALLFLPKDLHLNAHQESFVSSGVPLGAIAGAVMLIPANEYLGRRRAIIFALALYTIGAALEAGAISYPMMLVGRLILGFGVGIETGTVPVYVAESVERKYRGNLVSAYQMNIALGEVLGYVVAAIFLNVEGDWRYILGSSVVFSTIMWAGMLILPESPRFLLHKGKQVQAYQVWKYIRGIDTFEAKAEFYVMVRIAETEEREMKAKRAVTKFVWLDFVKVPRARRAIVYANIMILLGQFVGINGIMYYMATLMQQIGFDTADATYMSMVGGGALFLGTIPAIFYMEKFGRRFWAMTMLPGCLLGLALIGANYQLDATTNPAGVQGLYLSGVIVYMLFYGPYACLTWVIPSDVYPTYLRSYGMATSDAMVFLGSFIVTYNFSAMQAAMTKTGLMLGFFGGITVLGWFYQLFFMPEVKDMTLEEVGIVFSKPTRQLIKENIANTNRTQHRTTCPPSPSTPESTTASAPAPPTPKAAP
ncbi:MFS general substrate transporter [Teratosphaeria nubilosa]|uniref:MFS general substrate transporter n=1 Tax=Teratosphaeria nubilosa TaxID=161662 RepID=A0A6G1KXQ4_9PEZI|nr:MFS general substrate transporter [Teratosphaeria nubilosa]